MNARQVVMLYGCIVIAPHLNQFVALGLGICLFIAAAWLARS